MHETKSNVENSLKSLIDADIDKATEEEKQRYYKTALELVGYYTKVLREEKKLIDSAWQLFHCSFYILWKLRDNHD